MKIGGVYSDAVIHFAQSTHDFEGVSCDTCHGGDTGNDEYAHAQKGYVGTNPKEMANKCSGCHPDATDLFYQSAHYQEKYNWRYPNCWQCHGDHSIGRGDDRTGNACTHCHGKTATAITGSGESAIIWKSRSNGAHGNRIAIAMIAEGRNQPLSVEHTSTDNITHITVHLATDEKEKPLSLAEEVIAMISNRKELFHIIYTEEGDGALGEDVVQPTPRFRLSGGADFDAQLPQYGQLVRARDSLMTSIQKLNHHRDNRPPGIVQSISRHRKKTMRMFHRAPKTPDKTEIKDIIHETDQLKKTIDTWLNQPQ